MLVILVLLKRSGGQVTGISQSVKSKKGLTTNLFYLTLK